MAFLQLHPFDTLVSGTCCTQLDSVKIKLVAQCKTKLELIFHMANGPLHEFQRNLHDYKWNISEPPVSSCTSPNSQQHTGIKHCKCMYCIQHVGQKVVSCNEGNNWLEKRLKDDCTLNLNEKESMQYPVQDTYLELLMQVHNVSISASLYLNNWQVYHKLFKRQQLMSHQLIYVAFSLLNLSDAILTPTAATQPNLNNSGSLMYADLRQGGSECYIMWSAANTTFSLKNLQHI